MLLKLNQRHWPRLFLWLKVWYSIWMVFYHIESTLLIELTFQRRKSEGGCSEFLDRLLSVGLLEEEKNSSILWLLKHSYWSKVSLAVQNSSIGDLVTHSLTHSTFTFDIQRATLETCDLWDIWSEWWGDMTRKSTYPHTYLPTCPPTLEDILKVRF